MNSTTAGFVTSTDETLTNTSMSTDWSVSTAASEILLETTPTIFTATTASNSPLDIPLLATGTALAVVSLALAVVTAVLCCYCCDCSGEKKTVPGEARPEPVGREHSVTRRNYTGSFTSRSKTAVDGDSFRRDTAAGERGSNAINSGIYQNIDPLTTDIETTRPQVFSENETESKRQSKKWRFRKNKGKQKGGREVSGKYDSKIIACSINKDLDKDKNASGAYETQILPSSAVTMVTDGQNFHQNGPEIDAIGSYNLQTAAGYEAQLRGEGFNQTDSGDYGQESPYDNVFPHTDPRGQWSPAAYTQENESAAPASTKRPRSITRQLELFQNSIFKKRKKKVEEATGNKSDSAQPGGTFGFTAACSESKQPPPPSPQPENELSNNKVFKKRKEEIVAAMGVSGSADTALNTAGDQVELADDHCDVGDTSGATTDLFKQRQEQVGSQHDSDSSLYDYDDVASPGELGPGELSPGELSEIYDDTAVEAHDMMDPVDSQEYEYVTTDIKPPGPVPGSRQRSTSRRAPVERRQRREDTKPPESWRVSASSLYNEIGTGHVVTQPFEIKDDSLVTPDMMRKPFLNNNMGDINYSKPAFI